MSDLLRIGEDEVISTDEITRARDGMIWLKSGTGIGVSEEVWQALLALAHPRIEPPGG